MAYSLIPKPSSSLLWMDVAMFSVTVIMFVSLLENVLAQALRASVSSQAARFVDNLSRVTFPLTALLILLLLFVLGASRVDASTTMAVCLTLLSLWLFSCSVAVVLYCRFLPQKLLKTLVKLVSDANFRYHTASASLDAKELLIVFKVFDQDGRGHITADKVFQQLQAHGLSFSDEHRGAAFKERLAAVFARHGGTTLDLKGFCQHFGELFQFAPPKNDEEELQSSDPSVDRERSQKVDVDGEGTVAHPFEVVPN